MTVTSASKASAVLATAEDHLLLAYGAYGSCPTCITRAPTLTPVFGRSSLVSDSFAVDPTALWQPYDDCVRSSVVSVGDDSDITSNEYPAE